MHFVSFVALALVWTAADPILTRRIANGFAFLRRGPVEALQALALIGTDTQSIYTTGVTHRRAESGICWRESFETGADIRSRAFRILTQRITDWGTRSLGRRPFVATVTLTLARSYAVSICTLRVLTNWLTVSFGGLFESLITDTLTGSHTSPVAAKGILARGLALVVACPVISRQALALVGGDTVGMLTGRTAGGCAPERSLHHESFVAFAELWLSTEPVHTGICADRNAVRAR